MLLVTECENHINSLQQETESDKPQPKHRRKEKTSSALWSLFNELIAESENNDHSGHFGNEAEVVVEMYLKETSLSHSEHIPLSYRVRVLAIKEGHLAMLGSFSIQVSWYTTLFCCLRMII